MDFVHLHVHSPYSLLDGAAKISDIASRTLENGQRAVAITDHGVLHGVHEFYREMTKNGIKPIIGMEGYIVADHLAKNKNERASHILLLAQDYTGYQNISRMSSISHLEGFYRKPRIDFDLLEKYQDGIIVTSGCLAADIPQAIMAGDEQSALKLIDQYRSIFGDRFYLEVQPRDETEGEQWLVNRWLLEQSTRLGVKVVATTDAHYARRSDAKVHDTLLCIQTGALVSEQKRMRFDEDTYYLQSGDEIAAYFPDRLDVLSNTLEIAERTNVEFPKSGYHLPDFHVPNGHTQDSYLRELVYIGARWRYGSDSETHDVKERIEYELGVIKKMGFSPYFLTVWDICVYAYKNNIWWNVRGSAAGSVVAYCLGITTLDPIENNLYFERFLNPERISMPDIDIDFEDSRRSVMANYLSKRYGKDHVSQIVTFGYIKAKNAIKDFARVSGYAASDANDMTKFLDDYLEADQTLEDVEMNPEVSDWLNADEQRLEIFNGAKALQGYVRNTGVHAAGILVSDIPISEYVPLMRNKDEEGFGVAQFDDDQVEKLGLLKIDFLGLTTLTVLRETCALIKDRHGVELSPVNIPYLGDADSAPGLRSAYDMISNGHTAGVFQLESQGMTGVIRKMRPDNFEDISIAVALYRPGPLKFIDVFIDRKNGKSKPSYRHPKLKPILEPTLGIPCFQEQIMQIAMDLFDYTGAEADHLRKDMAKKTGKMAEHYSRFIENGKKNGLDENTINLIWQDIEGFASYAFNRCLPYDSELIDADTMLPLKIGDIVKNDLRPKVISFDLEGRKFVSGQVVEVFDNGLKHVYEVFDEFDGKIQATGNHPFLTKRGWVQLHELTTEDYVARRLYDPDYSGMTWLKVAEIRSIGKRQTFDVTVEKYHNFVANGFVVHNSHSADYAKISIQSAWVKANYPLEYMVSLMNSYLDTPDRLARFISECRVMGIELVTPDINLSGEKFSIVDNKIVFGLTCIKGVGSAMVEPVLSARGDKPFEDFSDLINRLDFSTINLRALTNMVKVGCFDKFGTREQFLRAIEPIRKHMKKSKKKPKDGQMTLLLPEDENVSTKKLFIESFVDYSDTEFKLDGDNESWEIELLGAKITSSDNAPMKFFENRNLYPISDLSQSFGINFPLAVGGKVDKIREITDKKGNKMAFVDISDYITGADTVGLTFFSTAWKKYSGVVSESKYLIVSGKADSSRGSTSVLVDSVIAHK